MKCCVYMHKTSAIGSEVPIGSFDIVNCQDCVANENDLFFVKASM